MSMQQGSAASYLPTLNCLEFTFSEGGPKLARGDQFWRRTDFFVTGHANPLILLTRLARSHPLYALILHMPIELITIFCFPISVNTNNITQLFIYSAYFTQCIYIAIMKVGHSPSLLSL